MVMRVKGKTGTVPLGGGSVSDQHELSAATEYEGDGCSAGMTWAAVEILGRVPPWQGCCDAHDAAYRKGGTARDRLRVDKILRKCVEAAALKHGYRPRAARLTATAMYRGIRALGGHHAPPLHLVAAPLVWLGKIESAPDYRWGRVPALV